MSGLKVPGVVWIAVLTAISAFLAANWPDAPWLHLITVAVGAVIKALEVQATPAVNERMDAPPSKLRRFLVG